MNTDRDNIRHVKATHEDDKTWCGHSIEAYEFVFKDAEHAAQNGRTGERLIACADCTNQIVNCLTKGW